MAKTWLFFRSFHEHIASRLVNVSGRAQYFQRLKCVDENISHSKSISPTVLLELVLDTLGRRDFTLKSGGEGKVWQFGTTFALCPVNAIADAIFAGALTLA